MKILSVCGLLLAAAGQADVSSPSNTIYRVIVDRNPFGLKPLPTNAVGSGAVATPPPVPTNIKLAGITADSMGKRAWIVFTPPPPRPGVPATNNAPVHYALREGDVQGDVRVVEIDARASTVRIVNAGQTAMLDFTNNAPAAIAVPTGVPGGAPGSPRMMPGAPTPVPAFNPGVPGAVPAPPRTASLNPAAPMVQPASVLAGGGNLGAGTGAAAGVSAAGVRTIPSRPTRVPSQEAQQLPQIDPAVQAALMEQQQREAQARGEFLPPIPR